MVQLEDDFIFKLKKYEMEINNNNVRRLNVEISQFVILSKTLGNTHHFSGSVSGTTGVHTDQDTMPAFGEFPEHREEK